MFANGFTAETRADRSSLDLPGTAARAKALGSARRGGRSAAVLDRRRAVGNLLEPSSALRRWDRGGGDREHASSLSVSASMPQCAPATWRIGATKDRS